MLYLTHDKPHHTPWNKGKLTGQKPPISSTTKSITCATGILLYVPMIRYYSISSDIE